MQWRRKTFPMMGGGGGGKGSNFLRIQNSISQHKTPFGKGLKTFWEAKNKGTAPPVIRGELPPPPPPPFLRHCMLCILYS